MDNSLKMTVAVQSVDELTADEPRSLLDLLDHILLRIADYQCGGPILGHADQLPLRWEDESYIYLESDHPDSREQEADVSVHDGKVYIRIAK